MKINEILKGALSVLSMVLGNEKSRLLGGIQLLSSIIALAILSGYHLISLVALCAEDFIFRKQQRSGTDGCFL